jgi:hypothetical protein
VTVIAYLDANSASMIASAAAAGTAGMAVAAKVGWSRVAGRFRSKPQPEADTTVTATAEDREQ